MASYAAHMQSQSAAAQPSACSKLGTLAQIVLIIPRCSIGPRGTRDMDECDLTFLVSLARQLVTM